MTKQYKILFVDDEQNILNSMKRNLRDYNITTCNSPLEAMKLVNKVARSAPFAVIVSDYRMPGVSGLDFLIAVKEVSPTSVRVMLTGYSENDTAIRAINEGAIFRFLTKPTNVQSLKEVLQVCLEQHKLIVSEKELLKGTLSGSIKVLTEVLSQSNPEAFGFGERVKRVVKYLIEKIEVDNKWQIEIAAMLSQIGLTAIPAEIISKVKNKIPLTSVEEELYKQYPEIGANLISHIPRLEEVSKCIRFQKNVNAPNAPFGARVLNLAIRYDEMLFTGTDPQAIHKTLSSDEIHYGPSLLNALQSLINEKGQSQNSVALHIAELSEGMIVDQDVFTKDNLLLISRGQEITSSALMRLCNYKRSCGIKEPIIIIK